MVMVIFALMTIAILYLMYDNRKLERLNRVAVRAAIKEQAKRKALEIMVYGREIESNELFDDETLYED